MKKCMIAGLAAAMVLTMAWTAFGQPQGGGAGQGPGGGRGMGGGRGGFGMNRDAQLKAIATLQEQAGKLKALIESMPTLPAGTSFQDMTDEQRTKMRDAGQKIREEQPPIVAAIQQQLDQIKGVRTLITENQQATTELKSLQELATKEKATETAKKIGEMIAARQKGLEEKAKAMGVEPDRLQQMIERGGGRGPGQ
jgi:hypothetical protein